MNMMLTFGFIGAGIGLVTAAIMVTMIKIFVTQNHISPYINNQLDDLTETFKKEIPAAAMFLKGKTLESLKERAGKKLLQNFPILKKTLIKKYTPIYLVFSAIIGFTLGAFISMLCYG